MINEGETYQHYKHDTHRVENNYIYEIIDLAFDTERKEEVVIYKPLYESDIKLFVRPISVFIETVELEGKIIPRFKKM